MFSPLILGSWYHVFRSRVVHSRDFSRPAKSGAQGARWCTTMA